MCEQSHVQDIHTVFLGICASTVTRKRMILWDLCVTGMPTRFEYTVPLMG
jgi:hypothetical protein